MCFERGLVVGGQDGPGESFTREPVVLDERHGRTQQLGTQRGRTAERHEQHSASAENLPLPDFVIIKQFITHHD